MKRDWKKPMMRLSLTSYCNDFLCFLLFLRLMVVVLLCVVGPLLITKSFGPGYGVTSGILAYPLWWYHFGLPRFKEQATGLYSASFCMWGYIVMTVILSVCVLEYFGVLKEATGEAPVNHSDPFSKRHIIRFLIILAALCIYGLVKGRLFTPKK